MENPGSPINAAIQLREDYGTRNSMSTEDVEESPSETYSAAASPYWNGPIQKAAAAKASKSKDGFSPIVAFCFTINYILGGGFLTVPWAFRQSGLLLSSIMLIISAVGSDMAKNYMLESMSWAEAMLDNKMHWNNIEKKRGANPEERVLLRPPASIKREQLLNMQNKTDKERLQQSISFQSLHAALSNTNANTSLQAFEKREVVTIKPTKYIVKDRKFEMNALCRVFLGKRGLQMFTLIFTLYMCGSLWAYTSIFSSALARAFPVFSEENIGDGDNIFSSVTTGMSLETLNYIFFAIVYGCIVVPLSCLELEEQVPLQVFLTGCRFLMLFLMIGTAQICADDIAAMPVLEKGMNGTFQELQQTYKDDTLSNFRWSGVAKTLPVLVFANIYHHSIPGLAHPVTDKRAIGRVFVATNAFTTTFYLVLGLSLATAFGQHVEQSCNLSWSLFHANTGHVDNQGNIVGAAWWAKAISMYVILFPAIDVVSAFPLCAITLGNNLLGAAYGKNIHYAEKKRWLRIAFRLLASIPPLILGILVRELGAITDYTGTTGFMIGLTFPALLYVASKTIARRRRFAVDTFYTNYSSTIPIASVVIWSGIIMVIVVFATLSFD